MDVQSVSKQASKQASRLNYLDVYKGICILFVIFTHYQWTDEQRKLLLFPFWIDMAVPVFMVITGYVTAYSFSKKNTTLKQAYSPKEVISKWLRFIIPYLPAYILSVIAVMISGKKEISVVYLVKLFVTGGSGPGSYYVPVMIQVVLIIPVIHWVVKKYDTKGLLLCFGVNVLYEITKTFIDLSPEIYRLCVFRYIFIISLGCYLYHNKVNRKNPLWYLVGVAGITYIIVFNYTPNKPFFTDQWTVTSVFAVLFIVPVMMFLMKPNKLKNSILELLGRASFNIFLVQMIYYLVAPKYIYPLLNNNLVFCVPVNILTCCLVGIGFYMVETPVTKTIVKKIKRSK